MALLAPNFDSSEFDVNEAVPSEYAANVRVLAPVLQEFRDLWGSPMQITSCYRDPARNATVPGAVDNSQHLTASAVDADLLTLSSQDAANQLLDAADSGNEPTGYSQCIFYQADHHVHIGLYDPQLGKIAEKLVKYSDGHYETLTRDNASILPTTTFQNP